jgi:hypothetical protein
MIFPDEMTFFFDTQTWLWPLGHHDAHLYKFWGLDSDPDRDP